MLSTIFNFIVSFAAPFLPFIVLYYAIKYRKKKLIIFIVILLLYILIHSTYMANTYTL